MYPSTVTKMVATGPGLAGRMIQQLIKNGFVEEAYEQMQPMVKRVKDNDGFFEWYTVDNKPKGSGTFRGQPE